MSKLTRALAALVALATAISLAACGGGDDEESDGLDREQAASRSRSSSGTARPQGPAELLQEMIDDFNRLTPTSSSRRTRAGSTPTGCCRR